MCGIAGIVGHPIKDKQNIVKSMTDKISHRGPDGEGLVSFDNCILGHRRLSIVDLNSGDQPMFSNNRKECIVFNGEIYGFKEIKDRIKQYPFTTTSDTEVILALYQEYQENIFEHLPGMFALAIWDEARQQLICGRDRFGEKPFYYAFGKNNEFIFASEIKAIISSGLVEPKLDLESVGHYMKHLYVNPTKTIYENIYTLAPAHFLTYSNGTLNIERYWKTPNINYSITPENAYEQFNYLLEKSVKNQLVADVPVGAFLSGGLDSSLIVALASKYKTNINTYSFGFGNMINELPYAKLVADMYSTNHTEIQQDLPDLGRLLYQLQDIYDEPFADSSNIPTYLIANEAAKHLKVVLTGDGGDELLGGYDFWYRHLLNIEKRKKYNHNTQFILKLTTRVCQKLGGKYLPYLVQQQNIVKEKGFNISQIHQTQNLYFTDNELSSLGLNHIDKTNYSFSFENTVSDAMRMDIENYMPGDILVKTDRAAMANSLELRAPFLDKEFAEFCITLPHTLKLNYKEEKLIAKQVFKNSFPKKIINRKKQGFGAPVNNWLNNPSLKMLKEDYLKNSSCKIKQNGTAH